MLQGEQAVMTPEERARNILDSHDWWCLSGEKLDFTVDEFALERLIAAAIRSAVAAAYADAATTTEGNGALGQWRQAAAQHIRQRAKDVTG